MMRQNYNAYTKRDEIRPGDIIHYPFLFPWQRDSGMTLAEKLRPCVAMLRFGPAEEEYLALVPLTTRPIRDWEQRVLIPKHARQAAGLNLAKAQSIVVDSCNIERIHSSGDLSARSNIPPLLSAAKLDADLLDELCRRFKNLQTRGKVHIVKREAPATSVAHEREAFTPIPGYS